MNRYQLNKEKIRDKAIEFEITATQYCYSYAELSEKAYYFEKMGRRYGLLKEFRENGVV